MQTQTFLELDAVLKNLSQSFGNLKDRINALIQSRHASLYIFELIKWRDKVETAIREIEKEIGRIRKHVQRYPNLEAEKPFSTKKDGTFLVAMEENVKKMEGMVEFRKINAGGNALARERM